MFAPNLRLDELLQSHLRAFLQGADEGVIGALQAGVEWLELPAGGVLMREGEPGDAMYVLASGRLRVSITGADGRSRTMREITRGQVVGEMSLIADAPRSATLVAVRDSVLARLSRPSFDALVRQHPAVTGAAGPSGGHRVPAARWSRRRGHGAGAGRWCGRRAGAPRPRGPG